MTPERAALIAPRLRVPAIALVLLAIAIVTALGVRYAGTSAPGGLDRRLGDWLSARTGVYGRLSSDVVNLADPAVVALLIAVLAGVCLWRGRLRGAVLAVLAPPLAGAITQYLLKPLVDRTIGAGGLAFPSGHTTGACAIAAVVGVLLVRSRLPRAVRGSLALVAVAYAAGVAAALIAHGYHYATDTVGGAAVAVATVLAVALVVDALSQRWPGNASGRGRVPWRPRARGRASARRSPAGPAVRSSPR